RHQDIRRVARGVDVVVGDAHLERRDAGQRAGGGADLGREVGEGGEVVAEQRGGGGELSSGDLHPVAGVAGKADYYVVERLGGYLPGGLHAGKSHLLASWLARRRNWRRSAPGILAPGPAARPASARIGTPLSVAPSGPPTAAPRSAGRARPPRAPPAAPPCRP